MAFFIVILPKKISELFQSKIKPSSLGHLFGFTNKKVNMRIAPQKHLKWVLLAMGNAGIGLFEKLDTTEASYM